MSRPAPHGGRALLIGLEEALADAVRCLSELRARADGVRLAAVAPPDLLEQTRAKLALWPADLVVIDSLSEYARVTAGKVPEDGDSSGRAAVLRPLVRLARDSDTALVVIHHVRRSDGQYRGSSEIAAAADALLELSPPAAREEPATRNIKGRGRWRIQSFQVELRDGKYDLPGGGERPLDARVLLHIRSHPGAGVNAIRQAVRGRGTTVDAAIDQLVAGGAIENRGGSDAFRFYALESAETTRETACASARAP